MAEETSPTKKKKYPWGAILWGSVAAAAAVRALYHPFRAVMRDGFVVRCSGDGCVQTMLIQGFQGESEIYALGAGTIVQVTSASIFMVLDSEPTLVEYTAGDSNFVPQVQVGQRVGAGQQIGLTKSVEFGVYNIQRAQDGSSVLGSPYEPASWLANHGLRVSHKAHSASGAVWCSGGRHLIVPQAVATCGIKLAPPNGFALLPVSATME